MIRYIASEPVQGQLSYAIMIYCVECLGTGPKWRQTGQGLAWFILPPAGIDGKLSKASTYVFFFHIRPTYF